MVAKSEPEVFGGMAWRKACDFGVFPTVFRMRCAKRKCLPRGAVRALGPFRGTAPRGRHSALPRGESGSVAWRGKRVASVTS